MLIVNPRTADTVFSHNAGKLFLPASNMKIVTGSVALKQLGPDYRYRTTFAARGAVHDSVLGGDLIVIGRGDPTISDTLRGSAMNVMYGFADSLARRGIRRITGSLVSGGNAFPDSIYGESWGWTTSASTTARAPMSSFLQRRNGADVSEAGWRS